MNYTDLATDTVLYSHCSFPLSNEGYFDMIKHIKNTLSLCKRNDLIRAAKSVLTTCPNLDRRNKRQLANMLIQNVARNFLRYFLLVKIGIRHDVTEEFEPVWLTHINEGEHQYPMIWAMNDMRTQYVIEAMPELIDLEVSPNPFVNPLSNEKTNNRTATK